MEPGLNRRPISALLRERGLRPKRRLGQNFLADGNFLEAIIREAAVSRADTVVEVGSGPGNLTERLAARAGRVWAFEVDPDLHRLSAELLAGRENVNLILGDGAEFERHVPPGPVKVVSNLPYSDWRRLLLALLSARRDVVSYTVMLQRDVYDRLKARPGTKEYGPMAALLQAACEVRLLRRAGRALFVPTPRVDSALVGIRRREAGLDFTELESRLSRLFARRRGKSAAAGGCRIGELPPGELLKLARAGL